MKTQLHHYQFNINDSDQHAAYKAVRERIDADGPRVWMNSWGGEGSKRVVIPYGEREYVETVELETEFLFSNQWNTTDGRRVFDHYEEYPALIAKSCKRGHWLEITDEMRAIRENTAVCGYCGHREPVGNAFCDKCLDSVYLKEFDLFLLRMRPCSEHLPKRKPLTDSEAAWLIPRYIERQTVGKDSRAVKRRERERQRVLDKYQEKLDSVTKETGAAVVERDGMLWLMDHNVPTDNVIYYSRTGRFGFGWRQPMSAAVKSALLDILVEFPFDYDIKAESEKSVA